MEGKGDQWRPPAPPRRSTAAGPHEQGRELSFTGKYPRSIDAKGRLIIPSRLRDELDGNSVVLSRWFEGCVALWTETGWTRLEESLRALPQGSPQARDMLRVLFHNSHREEVDRQGRIPVPPQLREWAAVERDVVVAGNFDHVEIWSPDRYDARYGDEAQALEELAEHLNF